ncbi:MAG: aromatic amino acid lyase [Myxococcota bacterium]
MSEHAIGDSLGIEVVEQIALGRAAAVLSPAARARMEASATAFAASGSVDVLRDKWEWLVGGEAPTASGEAARLFVLGHCAGVGPPLPAEEVRALIVTRAHALARGWSGVRPALVGRLLELLRDDVVPVVPSIGDVGTAGSIQLAHVARVALGYGGPVLDGTSALPPFEPTEKEALSLLNGSSYTTALAALAVARAERVLRAAEVAAALSFEVVRADKRCLSPGAAAARGHRGIEEATARLRDLVEGSELVTPQRSPDSFSVRCAPAVLGAARDAVRQVRAVVQGELDAPSDNPLVLEDEGVVETGAFHAAPVALAMDHLKIAMTQVASIAERRVFRLTYGRLSGLPSFLVPGSGVNSGLMLAQYTAASVLAEMKAMCMPASIDSIPTVQHQEDHASMGPVAARSALAVIDRVADVVGIELLCAAQGLDFRIAGRAVGPDGQLGAVEPQQPGRLTRRAWEKVRERVARWDDDQVLHPDLVKVGELVRAGAFDEIR